MSSRHLWNLKNTFLRYRSTKYPPFTMYHSACLYSSPRNVLPPWRHLLLRFTVASSLVAPSVHFKTRRHPSWLLKASDEDNCVNLARSPAPDGATTRENWGHSTANGIPALSFLCDDHRLVSAGGTCVFVWRYVRVSAAEARPNNLAYGLAVVVCGS